MKFYVASKFERSEKVKEVQQRLKEEGHEIIVDWTQHKNITNYSREKYRAAEYADEDLKGAMECDVFVLISNKDSRGSHLELGAALASGKPDIYVIGELREDSLFYFHQDVERRDDIGDVLAEL
jgi:nucleoside 2-deoxyribosyltransferase